MTEVVKVDKCVAVHWCGVVVVTLRRVVTAKKGEEAKTAKASDEGGTHGTKRRSPHNTTSARAVSATSCAGGATSHMNHPLDWVRQSEPIKHRRTALLVSPRHISHQ